MFFENLKEDVVYMTSDKIRTKHAFSTRLGGVSEGIYSSLNLGWRRGDIEDNVKENYRRLGKIFDVSENDFVCAAQVHKTNVIIATEKDKHKAGLEAMCEADGFVTDIKGLPLMVFVADCVPVLMCDYENKVIAAVHCGWRSSVADILKVAVEKMVLIGAQRDNICVAIGPAIGKDHFETGPEVPEAIDKYLCGEVKDIYKSIGNGKYLVDLRGANRKRLLQLGIKEENIDVSDECTMCKPDKYWSHRFTKGQRGSQCAAIIID